MPGLPGRAIAGPKVTNANHATCSGKPLLHRPPANEKKHCSSVQATTSQQQTGIMSDVKTHKMWYSSSCPAMKYIRGMMLWPHLSVPLGWYRTCWTSWTYWRNRLWAPRSKGTYYTPTSIKEKEKKHTFRFMYSVFLLDPLGWPWQSWPFWAIWAKRWRLSWTSGGYINTGTHNTAYFTHLSPMKTLFTSCRALRDSQVCLESPDPRAQASPDQR